MLILEGCVKQFAAANVLCRKVLTKIFRLVHPAASELPPRKA
jgi:hypothetical protein